MSKNLCPENNIAFENSQTIRFETPIPAGTYTISAIVESTDTDSSNCLLLFYYPDNTTLEVYLSRSLLGNNRVSKTFILSLDATKVRIYASEGYNPSVGDTGTFTQLMIEAGDQMTEYVPYGDEPEPEPEPAEETVTAEVLLYWAAMARLIPIAMLPKPTCEETYLIFEYLDPVHTRPFVWTHGDSCVERYLVDLINGTTEMINNVPKSDKEKYLHAMIGGTVDTMPDPDACELNYWMSKALEAMNQ